MYYLHCLELIIVYCTSLIFMATHGTLWSLGGNSGFSILQRVVSLLALVCGHWIGQRRPTPVYALTKRQYPIASCHHPVMKQSGRNCGACKRQAMSYTYRDCGGMLSSISSNQLVRPLSSSNSDSTRNKIDQPFCRCTCVCVISCGSYNPTAVGLWAVPPDLLYYCSMLEM